MIVIHLPDDMANDFLEWFNDDGHNSLRRYQRVNALLHDDQGIHAEANFINNTITITVDAPPKIVLVASGYEWECPNCGHDNHEIETKETVTCTNCNTGYSVDDTIHATG